MSNKMRRFASQMEAEDLALTCKLRDDRKLLIITRRSAYNGGHEESVLLVRDSNDVALLAVAITPVFRYEFVGNGVLSVTPSGKGNDGISRRTVSLHEMGAMVTILEETLASIKADTAVKSYGYGEWLEAYFPEGMIKVSEFVWESRENVREMFGPPRTPTPPAHQSSSSPSGYSKPDLETLKAAIASFIRSAEDPDDIAESDVVNHLKSKFGPQILGKYGYSKADIQKWTYTFYGQLEKPSQIDDRLYLGSEFNAANYEELKSLGVTHVLNVTSEVDKFYPGDFEYHQIHVLDVPSVNLMPYFGRALGFIESGLSQGGSVFVHCQRGVSRSATFVIAHMMRSKSWELSQALKHVKERRKIVKPNTGFIVQLKDLENAFVLGKFSVEPVFSRKPVSLLKEHHETKSASGKALHSPNGSSPMRRQSGKATKTQQPAVSS